MNQKYAFKIKDTNMIANKEILIKALSLNEEKLNINKEEMIVTIYDKSFSIKIEYLEIEKEAVGIINVEADEIENLELFDKTIREITANDKRLAELKCIYDGISSYYGTKIYSEIHEIERMTQEFLKVIYYLTYSKNLKMSKGLIDEMEKTEFSFSKLINTIFEEQKIEYEKLIEHIQNCIETGEVPKKEILPKNLWDTVWQNSDNNVTNVQEQGKEINELLEEIRTARNKIAHCRKFNRKDYDKCRNDISHIKKMLLVLTEAIEKEGISNTIARKLQFKFNIIQSEDDLVKKEYFKSYEIFEQDIRGRNNLEELNWDKLPLHLSGLRHHNDFYNEINHKSEDEIMDEIKELESINTIDGEEDANTSEDDLTLIVPAQKEGFEQVFLGQHEWYDVRIGKTRRNKIKYIAGYEVAPISGIRYVAKVKSIIPSDNYAGYWKIIFDGAPIAYDSHKELINGQFAPQNIRYVSKKKLDEVKTLDEILKPKIKNS